MNSKVFNFIFIALALCLGSCNGCKKIPANQFVLNSDNYGKDWRQLGPSETVPSCNMAGCYNVYLPATTMVGDLSSIQRVGKTGEVQGSSSFSHINGKSSNRCYSFEKPKN
jgi:hypothetical protein